MAYNGPLPQVVNAGGTGAATLTGVLIGNGTSAVTVSAITQYDVLIGGASNAISSVGPGTSGQILQSGGAASNPAYSTATYPATAGSSGNVLTSNGTNWTSAAASAVAIPWTDEAVSFNAVAGNGYIITAASVTATLPASPSQGNTISFIVGPVPGALVIQANTGQIIEIGVTTSTSAGTATNNGTGDILTLVYHNASTKWFANSVIGTWTLA